MGAVPHHRPGRDQLRRAVARALRLSPHRRARPGVGDGSRPGVPGGQRVLARHHGPLGPAGRHAERAGPDDKLDRAGRPDLRGDRSHLTLEAVGRRVRGGVHGPARHGDRGRGRRVSLRLTEQRAGHALPQLPAARRRRGDLARGQPARPAGPARARDGQLPAGRTVGAGRDGRGLPGHPSHARPAGRHQAHPARGARRGGGRHGAAGGYPLPAGGGGGGKAALAAHRRALRFRGDGRPDALPGDGAARRDGSRIAGPAGAGRSLRPG